MRRKSALITGINGMDGSHLADLLLLKGYRVYGLERRVSTPVRRNTGHLVDLVEFIPGDLTDPKSLMDAIEISQPDEVYNLAAQSFPGFSWKIPTQTNDVNAMGALNVFEAVRRIRPDAKVYQASTSEMYGNILSVEGEILNEDSRFNPRNPYGIGKVFAHQMAINYRDSYDMFVSCGILFNHESERRGYEFVTRKISNAVANINLGLQDNVELGTLTAGRDWGYSPDYVEAMWRVLQQDEPDEFVIATGKVHTIEDFLRFAFRHIGIEDWRSYVVQNPKFMRPAETFSLIGDASKAKDVLGWTPTVDLETMVGIMVDNDMEINRAKQC